MFAVGGVFEGLALCSITLTTMSFDSYSLRRGGPTNFAGRGLTASVRKCRALIGRYCFTVRECFCNASD